MLLDLSIAEAIDEVVVHHADRLHVRVNDGRTNETESSTLEVLADCIRLGGSRRNLPHRLPSVELGTSLDKTPAIGIETAELLLDFKKFACVAHRLRSSSC